MATMKPTVYYYRPSCTHAVGRRKDVGQTGEGEHYCSFASYDSQDYESGPAGYGTGDTPAAAKRSAYADLMRRLRTGE